MKPSTLWHGETKNMQEYLARYLALQMEKNKGKANNYTEHMESVRSHTEKLRWSQFGKVKNVGKDKATWWRDGGKPRYVGNRVTSNTLHARGRSLRT